MTTASGGVRSRTEVAGGGYRLSFVFVVDREAVSNPEFPIPVVDLGRERRRGFRAIPSTIQSTENNLSIANMDFFELPTPWMRAACFEDFANREDRNSFISTTRRARAAVQ